MMNFHKRLTAFVLLVACAVFAYAQKNTDREIDRNIEKIKFIPKGQWMFGGSFSYGQTSADTYKFIILEDINGYNYTFNVSPYFGYFIKDNMLVGGKFGYKRSMLRIDNISLHLSDDLNFDISDYYNLSHIYTGAVIFRNYLSLGKSKRFGLFNQVSLSLGGGQGKVISGKGAELTGTYQDIFELELGVTPGLIAFITNNVAIEASVNVMGFKYKNYQQVTDQIYTGSLDHSSVNFKIDIFSINIGMSFYIPYLNPLRKRSANKEK